MALKTNLIAYWKMEETNQSARLDSHGSNTLTAVGGTGLTHSATAKLGTNSVSSSGTAGDRLEITTAGADFSGGSFTITGWVQRQTSSQSAIMANYDIGVRSFRFTKNGFDQIALEVRNSSDTQKSVVSSAKLTTTGIWYFIAGRYDGATDKLMARIDSTSTLSTVWGSGPVNTNGTGSLQVGASAGGIEWNGLIDELAYHKRALTDAEIDQIYNSGSGLAFSSWDASGSPSGLLLPQKGARGVMRGAYRGAA